MPGSGDLAEESSRRQERRGQVLTQRLLPTFERQLPHGEVVRRPPSRDGCAHVDRAESRARSGEEAVDVRLARQVGLDERRTADLRSDVVCPLLATVVVDEHLGPLSREVACARSTDPTGRTGHDHALARKPRIHWA